MHKIFNKVILIVGVLIVTPNCFAAKSEVQVGLGFIAFNYTEYGDGDTNYDTDEGDDNIFLDGETGFIPGFIFKVKNSYIRSYTEWVGGIYYNVIDYKGQTQSGTPLTTVSDALLIDSHLKLGWKFSPSYSRNQSIYAGLGYRYWLRNIHSGKDVNGNPVAGLLEEYYWPYALLGYEVDFEASKNVNVGLDFRLTKMFDANMDIDFLGFGGYDSTFVDLGNRIGARFALPIEIRLSGGSYFVTPYYEIIDIGISNLVPVTIKGVQQGSSAVAEPRSETRNVGIELTWLW